MKLDISFFTLLQSLERLEFLVACNLDLNYEPNRFILWKELRHVASVARSLKSGLAYSNVDYSPTTLDCYIIVILIVEGSAGINTIRTFVNGVSDSEQLTGYPFKRQQLKLCLESMMEWQLVKKTSRGKYFLTKRGRSYVQHHHPGILKHLSDLPLKVVPSL